MDSIIQEQENNHVQLLSRAQSLTTDIDNLHKSSTHEHEAIVATISRQTQYVGRELNRINTENSTLARKLRNHNNDLNHLRSQTEHMFAQTQHSIDAVANEVQDMHTQTTFIASSIDATTRVVREELCTTIKPIIEQAFTAMDTRTEARMQRIEDLIQRIAHDIGENAQQPIDTYILGNKIPRYPETLRGSLFDSSKTINQYGVDSNTTRAKPYEQHSDFHYSVATYRRRWYQQWRIGSIEVEVLQTSHRVNGLPSSNSVFILNIHFRPSQSILRFPGISIVYRTGTNAQGYRQLAPMIATYPILDELHPVWKVIEGEELQHLQQMLASGEVQIRSEGRDGSTLLHVSVQSCLYIFSVVCMFPGQPHVAPRLKGMPKRIRISFFANQYTVCCP